MGRQSSTAASGGAYRSAGVSSATATLVFTGTRVDLVTAQGPAHGKVKVFIDDMMTPVATLDLYRASSLWRFTRSFTGLTPGAHTIRIQPTGTKNASSTGTKVVLDAFVISWR